MRFYKTIDDVDGIVPLPTRGSMEAAGYDLASTEDFVLMSGQRHMFQTGLGMEMRVGESAKIEPRSKLANKYGIMILAGRIDSDYRGEVRAILYNSGSEPMEVKIGDRIAQLVVQEVIQSKPVFIANPTRTARGADGIMDAETDMRK